jgi:hypothetical protein
MLRLQERKINVIETGKECIKELSRAKKTDKF